MARNHARVLTSIWADEDFCAQSQAARLMYLYLLSQPDLEHSGVIGLRVNRWADNCTGDTPEGIREALAELERARFVVVDWQKEELLVRSLIRRDQVWRQPNVFKSAAESIRAVRSAAIRAALLSELERLDLSEAPKENKDVIGLREALVDELRASLPNSSGNPSPNPSGNPTATPGEALAEAHAMGTEVAQGKGSSNGGSVRDSPSPSPRAIAPPARAPAKPKAAKSKRAAEQAALPGAPEKPETPGQRANRLVRVYTDQVPLTKYEAAMQVVRRAVDSGVDDQSITQALVQLAGEGRTLTLDTLRHAIYGPPAGNGSRPSTTTQRVQSALERAARYEQEEAS